MQGLILVNKPNGITSFSAVNAIKRKSGEKRVGHTGTLDPMATGVLPILIGRATALSSFLIDADKRYIAEIKLGITTDTDDITGEIISQKFVSVTDDDIIKAIANNFSGTIKQIPPIYSAIKKDGVPMYKLARKGAEIKLEPREVKIFETKILTRLNEENIFKIELHVSKGTYIRSFARDLGEALGCGATLVSLERTFTSGFDIKSCVKLDKVNEENISDFILSEEAVVSHLKEINVTEKQAVRFCNGGQLGFDRLKSANFNDNEFVRVKYNGKLLGMGFADNEKQQLAIKCIINYPEG